MKTHRIPTRTIAMTGMLSAVSTVLMFFSFSVPLMPSFIKLDFPQRRIPVFSLIISVCWQEIIRFK